MAEKPTYEEIGRSVKKLEAEAVGQTRRGGVAGGREEIP